MILIIYLVCTGERLLLSPKNSISVGVTLVAIGTNHGTPTDSNNSSGAGSRGNNGGSIVDSIRGNGQGGEGSNVVGDSGNDGSSGERIEIAVDSNLALLTMEDSNKELNNSNIKIQQSQNQQQKNVNATESFVGSMLFQRNVSGCRVVVPSSQITNIASYEFANWGAHTSYYPDVYFTAACSIGLTSKEIDTFLERLENVWNKYEKTHSSISSHTVSTPSLVDGDK